MRKLMLPVAVAAALAFVALDATPAKAQVVVTSGYSPGYYGGYPPYAYGGSGIVIGNGGFGLGTYPGYSGYPGYGYTNYSPYYGGGYNPYYRSSFGGGYGDRGFSGG
ncbi:MAG TPA: hypothetical protein VH092_23980, partial [Urbifossiella sp.]|nr:hypothetical protein [Urbifossiella sp.]